MKTITVQASRNYDVVLGENLLAQLGMYIATIQKNCKVAVVSDSNVWPLYKHIIRKSLQQHAIQMVHYVFPAGEASKNARTYIEILNFLANNQISRSDLIIALGGGVVGDITGFAAATYLRGIAYVQIPTTLLAMVDSSVGGKTAIDLPTGKNLAGAFKQPHLVLCDISTLNTLPQMYFIDGCAEIIKYGMLYDAELISYLNEVGLLFDRESVIAKCVAFKRDVVQMDEFDTGARQKLNLGHTIGHGIEVRSNFHLTHGQCVAAGMALITKAAVNSKLCDITVYNTLCRLLQKFTLPYQTTFSAKELYESALSDKKRTGAIVNLIIPRNIGDCDIIPTPVSKLESFIEAGL